VTGSVMTRRTPASHLPAHVVRVHHSQLMTESVPDTDAPDPEAATERLEAALADAITALAEVHAAAEACRGTDVDIDRGVLMGLQQHTRKPTEAFKHKLVTDQSAFDADPDDVEGWGTIETLHDEKETTDDRPFRP